MELTELLKKLKNIKPDSDYSRKSRAVILSHRENHLPVLSFSLRQITTGVLHSGWSMAMMAVLLLLTIGSFSVLKLLSPATTAVVDITGLKAEAQAIDARIELTNIVYSEFISVENKTSTTSMISREAKSAKTPPKQKENDSGQTASGSLENAPAQLTIDSALDILSQ